MQAMEELTIQTAEEVAIQAMEDMMEAVGYMVEVDLELDLGRMYLYLKM